MKEQNVFFLKLKYENSYHERKVIMLVNLDRVRKEKDISLADLADVLNVRTATVSDKINGKSDFKFSEAVKIHNLFFSEYEISYLFEKEESKVV